LLQTAVSHDQRGHGRLSRVFSVGKSWVYAITQSSNHLYYDEDVPDRIEDGDDARGEPRSSSEGEATRAAIIRQRLVGRHLVNPRHSGAATRILPTEVGSRVGLMYTCHAGRGELHLVVNGEEYGPCARDIE